MILTDLKIELGRYGPDKGKYIGGAKFTDASGDVTINLSAEHCEKIFLICADAILGTAKEAASNLVTAVIEHKTQLEVKNDYTTN